ncbi:hypothetical protein P12x_003133 [Tundrisphaera lichenicola]|uniref:hypothetical protein n=1 Tax=Tundrisphaera lichenicola TaxID=2029860 RepID=UPI003EC02981
MRYRTEIFVAADRYVCLQLPGYLPEGRAIVTVHVEENRGSELDPRSGDEPDRSDVEWWEEFDEEARRPY